jgi:hypothetical protein
MANFFKHVGEHNGKKVIIVQRAIPGEAHLAAVIYSQIIPTRYHDDIMSILQSPEGQQSNEFMDIMNRRMLSNGGNMLVTMVNEGFVKKAQSAQIIVKPNANSAIRLDELNNLLTMAGQGTEAIRKLEELDRQQGRKDPIKQNAPMIPGGIPDVLDDTKLANDFKSQAARMRNEANALLTEAENLEAEAEKLAPSPKKRVSKPRGKTAKTTSTASA